MKFKVKAYLSFQTNEVDFNIPKRRKDLVQKVIGSGMHRKIVLTSSLSKDTKYHTEGLSYAMPQPTLEFALLCLKNALFLLPNNSELNLSMTTITNPQTVSLALTPGHNMSMKIFNIYLYILITIIKLYKSFIYM